MWSRAPRLQRRSIRANRARHRLRPCHADARNRRDRVIAPIALDTALPPDSDMVHPAPEPGPMRVGVLDSKRSRKPATTRETEFSAFSSPG